MTTISAQLRNFKEPDRDEQSLLFFSIPPSHVKGSGVSQNNAEDDFHKMEINAVLSLAAEGTEDTYVRTAQLLTIRSRDAHGGIQAGKLHLVPPYLAFASLDRKSVRFTIPLCTVRRVERLNTRAGVYALSLSLWHGMKIVRLRLHPGYLFMTSPLFERLFN